MNSDDSGRVTRRRFLGGTAATVAGAAAVVRGVSADAATPTEENPWRYDVDRLRQVDPARIGYERVLGFAVGAPGVRNVVWGRDGRILVSAGRRVRVFQPDGALVVDRLIEDVVRCLAVGEDGRVFVGLRDRVEIYDAEGKRSARWPSFSGRPFLTGLALGEGKVYVADSGNRVVYRCGVDGAVQVRIGEKNAERRVPGLVLPSPALDVELGADGLLRVNNAGRHRVEVYTPDGDLEQSWGRAGVALDAFCGCCNPIALALLSDGRVVTAEKGLLRVKVYSATGIFETAVAGPDRFAGVMSDERSRIEPEPEHAGLDVAAAADGRLAVLDRAGGTVQVFQRKGDSLKGA